MSVKSRGSKQKIRRWSFEFIINNGETDVRVVPPGMAFGSSKDAQETAKQMVAEMEASQPGLQIVKINYIPKETVSYEVMKQLSGLNRDNKILGFSMWYLANKVLDAMPEVTEDDREIKRQEVINEAYVAAQAKFFPSVPVEASNSYDELDNLTEDLEGEANEG